jgi:hypothetical protein
MRESHSQSVSGAKRRRQGLLTSREHVRLVTLAVLLAALLLAGRELGRRSTTGHPTPAIPETGTPGPDREMLEEVAGSDYQKVGVEENPEALRFLVDWAAAGGPGVASSVPVSYSDLMEMPDTYRGRGVIIEGQLMRVAESTVPGVLFEGQLMDAERQIYSFFAPGDLGLAEGSPVRLYGVFYRIAAYENRKGGFEVTPLVILWAGKRLEEGGPWWKWGVAAIAITAFLLVGIFLLSRYDAQDRRRFRIQVARRRSKPSNETPDSTV